MREILFILSVIGFIWAFIKIELWLIHKSRESFKELKEAYKNYKKSKEDLYKFIK
jgi:hypothetical protein